MAPAPQIMPMTNVLALPADTLLGGDYRIERVLGAGGFGITYLARDLVLDRAVTIKEYFPVDFAARGGSLDAIPRSEDSAADYQWGLARFIEEAKALAQFDHQNIVKVYRYFEANRTAYMVLHFEEGRSLKAWQKSLRRAPRQRELDDIISPLLDALSLIHKADFLHRDIAPDNIIIRTDSSPVLIDFGSARGEIARHSRTVSALVKPGYSPYEQYAETGSQQGPWTDIYALGATLYHVVTGKRPPDAPSRIVKDEYLSAHNGALSSYRTSFLSAIDHALALDIDRRPRNIEAWRGELLSPDAARPSFFRRESRKPVAAASDGRTVVLDDQPPPIKLRRDATVPPPPDSPGKKGGFLDFLDGLRTKTIKSPKFDGSAPKPGSLAEALEGVEDAATIVVTPKQDSGPPIEAKRAKAKRGERKSAGNAADIGVSSTTSDPDKQARRRPRAIRSGKRRSWRPLAIRLLIGAGIAGLAVNYQDTLSRIGKPSPPAKQQPTAAKPARVAVAVPSRAPEVAAKKAPKQVQAKAPPKTASVIVPLPINAHNGGARTIVFASGGKWAISSGLDATLKVWDAEKGNLVRSIGLDNGPATSVAVLGTRALTGHSNGTITLWDTEDGSKIDSFNRNNAAVWSVAFAGSADRFLAASHDWKIGVFDVRSGSKPVHVFDDHQNAVKSLAYSQGGRVVVSGGADRSVKLWDFATLELVRTYRGNRDYVSAVAVTRDGTRIASGNIDGNIRIWSTRSSRLLRRYTKHEGRITSLAFSPDGSRLLSASRDGTLRLWQVGSRRALMTVPTGSAVNAIAFSPDGSRIAAALGDGRIRFWGRTPADRNNR